MSVCACLSVAYVGHWCIDTSSRKIVAGLVQALVDAACSMQHAGCMHVSRHTLLSSAVYILAHAFLLLRVRATLHVRVAPCVCILLPTPYHICGMCTQCMQGACHVEKSRTASPTNKCTFCSPQPRILHSRVRPAVCSNETAKRTCAPAASTDEVVVAFGVCCADSGSAIFLTSMLSNIEVAI